jgi:hypothetical protein
VFDEAVQHSGTRVLDVMGGREQDELPTAQRSHRISREWRGRFTPGHDERTQ